MTEHDTHDGPHGAHGRLRDGIDTVIDTSRDKAGEAARLTAETIETNPLGVLVGGLALGALIAAVIPRSVREKQLLAPVGKTIGATAVAAFAAAKEAGRSELGNLGLTKGAAKDQARSLFQGVVKAATSAGAAAAQAGKDTAKTRG